jgi:hypothetical protein
MDEDETIDEDSHAEDIDETSKEDEVLYLPSHLMKTSKPRFLLHIKKRT